MSLTTRSQESTNTQPDWYLANFTKYCQYRKNRSAAGATSLPDVALGLTHLGTLLPDNAYEWCDMYLELKNDESLLSEAAGEVLDRAEKRRKAAGVERKVVLGAASTGIHLEPMIVFTDVLRGNRVVMGSRCSLAQADDDTPSVVHADSRALPEVLFQIFLLMHQSGFLLKAGAGCPKLEPFRSSERRYAVQSAAYPGEIWEVKIVCTYVDFLFRGGCYLVELGGGEQKAVLKRSSTEVARRTAEAVGIPPQLFSQVQNEIRVREALGGSRLRIPDILWSGWGVEPLSWRNCPVVLMTYVGESFHGRTLPLADAAEMGASLMETVQELHKRGIIHRDISPRNVAYREQATGLDRFYLLDFGIAAFVSDAAELSPVKDLEFGSMDSVLFGRAVNASADMEAILYTIVKVAGMELPWSAAAQDGDEEAVRAIRREVLDRGLIADFKQPVFSKLQNMVFPRAECHQLDVPGPVALATSLCVR